MRLVSPRSEGFALRSVEKTMASLVQLTENDIPGASLGENVNNRSNKQQLTSVVLVQLKPGLPSSLPFFEFFGCMYYTKIVHQSRNHDISHKKNVKSEESAVGHIGRTTIFTSVWQLVVICLQNLR